MGNIEVVLGAIWAAWMGGSDWILWGIAAYVILHLVLGNICAWTIFPSRFSECFELRAVYGFRIAAGMVASLAIFIFLVWLYTNPFYLGNPIVLMAVAFWFALSCGIDLFVILILGNKLKEALEQESCFLRDDT